jgi:hypothetical protein
MMPATKRKREILSSRQCLRMSYRLVLFWAVMSYAFGCARFERGSVYVRGDYVVVHADARTSATLNMDVSRDRPESILSSIIRFLNLLWR